MSIAARQPERVPLIRADIVDLGCGGNKWPGSFGVDRVHTDSVDLVWDLSETPYPFEDASATLVVCQHTLEHFAPDDAMRIIAEIHRILKPGGHLRLVCPHAACPGAAEHPMHKSQWTFRSFDWLSQRHPGSYYVAKSCGFDFEPIHWAAYVNLWSRWRDPPRWKQFVNAALSRAFTSVLAHSETLPDLLAKSLPFYRVDIAVTLRKSGGGLGP